MTRSISIIIPAYNEEKRLPATLERVAGYLQRGDWSFSEILVVEDGSADGTVALAERLRASYPALRVVRNPGNRGKGYAVRHGLRSARGAYRLFTDVDLAYGFRDVQRVADTLRAGAAAAIASRLHPDSRLVLPPGLQGYAYRRHLQSQFFSALVRRLLPLTQRDTQAGLKGLSAAAAEALLPGLRCDGFGFAKPTRLIQIGESAGATLTLPADSLRTSGVEIYGAAKGFDPDTMARLYAQVVGWAQSGELTFDLETVPLSDIAAAWQRTGSTGRRLVVIP